MGSLYQGNRGNRDPHFLLAGARPQGRGRAGRVGAPLCLLPAALPGPTGPPPAHALRSWLEHSPQAPHPPSASPVSSLGPSPALTTGSDRESRLQAGGSLAPQGLPRSPPQGPLPPPRPVCDLTTFQTKLCPGTPLRGHASPSEGPAFCPSAPGGWRLLGGVSPGPLPAACLWPWSPSPLPACRPTLDGTPWPQQLRVVLFTAPLPAGGSTQAGPTLPFPGGRADGQAATSRPCSRVQPCVSQ